MAIHNPSDLYTFGDVKINTQPSVNMYAQLLQKKQAREDALDAYERNRMSRINDKGMRDIDREVLDKSLGETMAYHSANKNAIRKGNTPEAYNYEKMWRTNNDIVSESRDRSARSDAAMKYRDNLLKMGRNVPDEFWHDYKAHELAIGGKMYDSETGKDIESKSIDLTKYLQQQTPKYDQKKSMDLLKGIKLNDLPVRYEAIQGQPDLRNEIHEKKLDAQGLDAISHIAKTEYDNDGGFAAIVQNKVADPLQRGELEKVFQKHFNTNPQGYSDYAIAEKLSQIQPSLVTQKAVSDWPYKNKITSQQARTNIYLNQSKATGTGTLADYDILGNYSPKIVSKEINVRTGKKGVTETKMADIIFSKDIDVNDKKLFGDKVYPITDTKTKEEYYIVNDDGDLVGDDGQIIYRAKVAQANMDKTALNEERRGRLKLKPNQTGAPTAKPVVIKGLKKG